MAEYVVPNYLQDVAPLNAIYNTDIGRRFARTTRTAAAMLLNGTREALRTGNETNFNNTYLQYSGQQPSNVGINDGGVKADVLRRVIQTTASINVPANVGQNELSSLGSRLQTSNSIARSDIILDTACLRFVRNDVLEIRISGRCPLIVGVRNFNNAAAVNLVFSYSRPSGMLVASAQPFIHGMQGGAPQQATAAVYLSRNLAGVYYIAVPQGQFLSFSFTADFPTLIDAASDFNKASRGYKRAISCGLLVERMYSCLDEYICAVCSTFVGTEPISSFLIMLLEAYEDKSIKS